MAKTSTTRRDDRVEARRQRRRGIRVAAQYLREARAANPDASAEDLQKIVADEMREDFADSPDWLSVLLQLVELLLKAWLG